MRKYISSLILFGIGIILISISVMKNNKTNYVETVFADSAINFEESFTGFINNTLSDVDHIKNEFNTPSDVRDTLATKNFFLNYLNKKPYLQSIVFIEDNYKVAVRKDGKSIVFAVDSTIKADVVKWQRFQNNQLIGSWKESLEGAIYKTSWYRELKKYDNQIQWFFNSGLNDSSNKELFYNGISYKNNSTSNIILFEFLRNKIDENFSVYKNFENIYLSIETIQGEHLNLSRNSKGFIDSGSHSDSLNVRISNHFKNFKDSDKGIFNFNLQNETYWNSFKRYPKKTGVSFYLLTLTNKDLEMIMSSKYSKSVLWLGIALIALSIILLLVKKRLFYSLKQTKIPPLKEILEEDENRFLEFKSSLRYDYRQEKINPELEKVIFKSVAAFGNTDGGILIIGIDDDKNILGLEKDYNSLKKKTIDYFEVHLNNLFHSMMGVKYVSKHIRMKFEKVDDKKVVAIVKVLRANRPLFLKFKNKNGKLEEKFFVRSGNSSQEIVSIQEINDYINTRFKK